MMLPGGFFHSEFVCADGKNPMVAARFTLTSATDKLCHNRYNQLTRRRAYHSVFQKPCRGCCRADFKTGRSLVSDSPRSPGTQKTPCAWGDVKMLGKVSFRWPIGASGMAGLCRSL